MFKIDILGLCDKLSHENEEKDETINELQTVLKFRTDENKTLYKEVSKLKKEIERLHQVFDIKDSERVELVKENKELQRIINDLQSDLVGATNDYKQAVNEVKLLNKQCDKLIAEMFRNGCLESIEALMAEGEIYDIDYTRWIPVSERLPNEGEAVLTQAIFNDDLKMAVSSRIDYNYWTGWGTRDINIVAWMPLPKPYKAESECK